MRIRRGMPVLIAVALGLSPGAAACGTGVDEGGEVDQGTETTTEDTADDTAEDTAGDTADGTGDGEDGEG